MLMHKPAVYSCTDTGQMCGDFRINVFRTVVLFRVGES